LAFNTNETSFPCNGSNSIGHTLVVIKIRDNDEYEWQMGHLF
jgi:hypothetical protein